MRKGAPRRLSVSNSKRLYEAIKATINRGASDRGFAARGGDNRSLRSLSQVYSNPLADGGICVINMPSGG